MGPKNNSSNFIKQTLGPGVFELDQLDRQLLTILDLNCRTTTTELSEKLATSRQTIEYRMKRLVTEGVITSFHASFNPTKMGYRLYKIYLKLRNDNQGKVRLINYLDNLGNVYWWGETSGSWDMLVGMFYRTELELFRITNELISNFNDLIMNEYGHTIVDVLQFPKMYFTGELHKYREYAGEVVQSSMDQLDYQILSEILNNARISVTELTSLVGSTAAIVRGRLEKLEQRGVIYQYRISVDYKKIGLENYKTLITLDRYTDEDEAKLMEYLLGFSNVEFFLRNIWQIEIGFTVSSFKEYSKILEEIKQKFPQIIRSVDTLMIGHYSWTKGFRRLLKN